MSGIVKDIQRFSGRLHLRPVWWALCATVLVVSLFVAVELRTAYFQSLYFTREAGELTYAVETGANEDAQFPLGGPQDQRLGYSKLPSFIDSLQERDFSVVRQAAQSPELGEFVGRHGYAVYHEKEVAGLTLHDRDGAAFYTSGYPQHRFGNFGSIPPLIVNTLLFIEDRDLLDDEYPRQNPAVIWHRFVLAAAGQVGGVVNSDLRQGGASTLATQIEKFRHYPD